MPELPDIALYLEALNSQFRGIPVGRVRVVSPFIVRTYEPHISAVEGRALVGTRRLGKRLVRDFGDELYLVIHLMIAGRLRKKPRGAALSRKVGLLALDFPDASLVMTEASSKKRASLHVIQDNKAAQTRRRRLKCRSERHLGTHKRLSSTKCRSKRHFAVRSLIAA